MAIFDLQNPWVFTFGILGNIISICVYLAPLTTFIRICKTKSTMGFQSLPYVVALFSCMLWVYYAMLKVDAVLLISVNAIGCVVETIYITIYLIYATKDARKHTVRLVAALNVAMFSMVFLGTVFTTRGPVRIAVVGWICVAVTASVFAAPLTIVFQVVRTKSVEFMPLPLSFFLTLSAVTWFAYGALQKDLYVAVPNIFGFLLGVLQMILYGIYRNAKKPIEPEEKEVQVTEHVINIVSSSPEVHPVDSPASIACDNEENSGEEEEEVHPVDSPASVASDNEENSGEEEEEGKKAGYKGGGREGKCVNGPDEDERYGPVVNVKPMIDSPVLVMCTA